VAVVLAGGRARRLGGVDKPATPVGGTPMLHRVLAAVAGAHPRIVVGPHRGGLPDGVLQVREEPPGGGPVAAAAAGLAALRPAGLAAPRPAGLAAPRPAGLAAPRPAGPDAAAALAAEVVVLLAADLPYLTPQAVTRLLAALDAPDLDGAVLVDDTGRRHLLCGAWRVRALQARLDALGPPAGRAMRRLVDGLSVAEVRVPASEPPPWYDCDTEEDLRRAEEWTANDRAR